MARGVDPATASVVGTMTGSAASGALATVGDWSRRMLETMPTNAWGTLARLPFTLLARIG
jgi:hypothetical protein